MTLPVLIALSGLPGVGKTSVARSLARALPAQHLRIDTIETALRERGVSFDGAAGDTGYLVAYALARDALALGMSVVVDAVHGWPGADTLQREATAPTGARFIRVDLSCSDPAEHRARVEHRRSDLPGLALPTWDAVMARDFSLPEAEELRLDTAALSIDDATARILALVHAAG